MPPSNATSTSQSHDVTVAPLTTPLSEHDPSTVATTPFPFVYGPIGTHKKKPGTVVGAGSTGQMTVVDSGGTLGIVMAVAVVVGIVLMFLLWLKAGEDFDVEEEGLLEDGPSGRTAEAEATTRTDIEDEPGSSAVQEPSLTEAPPDADKAAE